MRETLVRLAQALFAATRSGGAVFLEAGALARLDSARGCCELLAACALQPYDVRIAYRSPAALAVIRRARTWVDLGPPCTRAEVDFSMAGVAPAPP